MTETSYRRYGFAAFCAAVLIVSLAAVLGGVRAIAIAAVPSALLAAGGVACFRSARMHYEATSRVLTLLENAGASGFTVAPIANELELCEFWKLNRELYGVANTLSFEAYLAWWRSYPPGILGLFQKNELVGGLSIWPLRKQAFRDALSGRQTISHRGFPASSEIVKCAYWYVAGVVVKPGFRRRDALQYLLCEGMHRCLNASREVMHMNLCSAASTPEGARLLQRFGFTPAAPRRNDATQLVAYTLRNVGPRRLHAMADRFAALGARKPPGA